MKDNNGSLFTLSYPTVVPTVLFSRAPLFELGAINTVGAAAMGLDARFFTPKINSPMYRCGNRFEFLNVALHRTPDTKNMPGGAQGAKNEAPPNIIFNAKKALI